MKQSGFTELIPFRGVNPSGKETTNLLARKDNLYVMDNHRMALWCWFQHIDHSSRYHILHVDAHYDLDKSEKLDLLVENMSLQEYENFEVQSNEGSKIKAFTWDNYISRFLQARPNQIENIYACTHKLHPQSYASDIVKEIDVTSLSKFLVKVQKLEMKPIILNIDIDFFFESTPIGKIPIFGKEYIKMLASEFKNIIDRHQVAVTTVALSPECCSVDGSLEKGWDRSLNFAQSFLNEIGYNFDVSSYLNKSHR